jgi:plastocyanin
MKLYFIFIFLFSLPGLAFGGPVEVHLTIKDHRFTPAEVRVKGDKGIKLVVRNEDAIVEEFESPSLRREKKIRAGQTIEMLFPALKPGVYEFYGEFHEDTARGRLIVE